MSTTGTKRWKRGDIGPDGRVFWGYHKSCKNREFWVSDERFNKYKSEFKANSQTTKYKSYFQNPEYNARHKVYRQKTKNLKSARSYMTALLAAQQLSEALKNKHDNDNENAK